LALGAKLFRIQLLDHGLFEFCHRIASDVVGLNDEVLELVCHVGHLVIVSIVVHLDD
jgi:hypothetical protein